MSAGVRTLFHPGRFKVIKNTYERKTAERLPQGYQKFFKEWKEQEPSPVHWIPKKGRWERNPETGEVKPIQNHPVPIKYPHQLHQGIWGGEAVIQGTVKKGKYRSPVPRFWVPRLKESVLYSEVLDKYFEVVVTERTHRLVDKHFGFDNYLLQTPACDIQSTLALKIKRRILLALIDKDFAHDNPTKQEEIFEKYKQYIVPKEEAEWYGFSVEEAKVKYETMLKNQAKEETRPLKHQYRLDLLNELDRKAKEGPVQSDESSGVSSWVSKLNPFSKPKHLEKS